MPEIIEIQSSQAGTGFLSEAAVFASSKLAIAPAVT
jgi:hypothetical protein